MQKPSRAKSCTKLLLVVTAFVSSSMPAGSKLHNDENVFQPDQSIADLLKDYERKDHGQKLESLRSFHKSTPEGRVRQKAAYVLARLLKKTGTSKDASEAIPLFEEASAQAPLYEHCRLQLADCANTVGDEKLFRQSLTELLARAADQNLKARVHYQLAQSYLRAGENSLAELEFTKLLKLAPDSQFATGAGYYLGQLACSAKDYPGALKHWRIYLAKSPDGRFAPDILAALVKNKVELSKEDHSKFARVYFAAGQYARALAEWKLAEETPDWYEYGLAVLRSGQKAEGKKLLEDGIKKNPADRKVPEAAKLLARIGSRQEAISIWKLVLEECPDYADAALFNLGVRAADEESLAFYEELLQKHPDSEYAPESSWWLCWNKIKTGKLKDAIKSLESGAQKFEQARSGPRFSYWLGKVFEKQNNAKSAKLAYEQTVAAFGSNYYGWRARGRLAALSGSSDPAWSLATTKHLNLYQDYKIRGGWQPPETPQVVSYKSICQSVGPELAALTELHQWDECLSELPAGKLQELRALYLAKMNMSLESINTASKDIKGSPHFSARWQLAYPLWHSNTISREAQAKDLDPLLAQALVREESRYNIYAISSSNAIGLMQLLPSTAMGVAKRLGVKINSHEDIHKPENNLKLGIDYLSYVLGRFKGNAMLAVASYNGGPNAVAAWTQKYPLSDPDGFVENIPYTETRDYVRKVFGSYWNYKAIYENKKQQAMR